jgi:hypothetical protein
VSADPLDRGFQRQKDLSLADYAAQSFSVFQEEPLDVALCFTTEAARLLRNGSSTRRRV